MKPSKPDRKQDILDAALHCFNAHGVEASTIDMIRERCGASVGSVYHHFGNKENIAATLFHTAMEDHHVCQLALLAKAHDAQAGVKALAYAYVDWVSANPDKARFALHNRGVLAQGEAGAAMQARVKERLSSLLKWFKPHIESGQLKKLPIELYGSLITGPAHDYARLWLAGRAKADIRKYREIFAEAAWAAVRA
jgi:AcrR family transcriptional regulator